MGRRKHDYGYYPLVIGFAAAGSLFVAFYFLLDWPAFLAWLGAFSLITFILFGLDKGMALTSRNRIPERVLHLFTLGGGFPGQFFGRLLFRHKINFSRHPTFNIVLIASLLLWAAMAYFLNLLR